MHKRSQSDQGPCDIVGGCEEGLAESDVSCSWSARHLIDERWFHRGDVGNGLRRSPQKHPKCHLPGRELDDGKAIFLHRLHDFVHPFQLRRFGLDAAMEEGNGGSPVPSVPVGTTRRATWIDTPRLILRSWLKGTGIEQPEAPGVCSHAFDRSAVEHQLRRAAQRCLERGLDGRRSTLAVGMRYASWP